MALLGSGNNGNSNNGGFEKAAAFVNIYLPTQEGGRVKIGAIPLRAGKPTEKKLLTWLQKDPANVETMRDKLIVDFREVTNEAADLAL